MKYKDLLLEGKWLFHGRKENTMCVFENIYNHSQITLSNQQVKKVIENKETIGRIMSRRIKVNKNQIYKYGNGVQRWWNRYKYMGAAKQK